MSQATPQTTQLRWAIVARRGLGSAAAGVGLMLALQAPSVAQAETATLRWSQPKPGNVAGFRVHIGGRSGSYSWSVPLGLPKPNASGVYTKVVELGADPVIYIALSSFNSQGRESAFSNEKRIDQRSEPLGQPGAPKVVIDF